MSQNTSSAVMQQRHEPTDSLDFFPTPLWATRALCEWLAQRFGSLGDKSCLEPACGQGHMARALADYFRVVISTDVFDYGFGAVEDFLFPGQDALTDWTITNPPFRLALQFIAKGLSRSRVGTAMLVRTSFLEGVGRHDALFSKTPPLAVLQFSERVPMFKGKLDEKGSTATSYCWLVFGGGRAGWPTEFHWIPPCRRRLERAGDYRQFEGATP